MLRILGAVCIFSASALVGIHLSENIRNKKERLVLTEKMFSEISDYIRWNSLTLHEIADRLFKSEQFAELEFVSALSQNCKNTRSFPSAWENAVKSDNQMCGEEKKFFYEIGNTLGTTDTQGQLSALDMYKSRIEKMILEESERYRIKGKLYRSLGAALGAMTGILMI